MLFDLQEQVFKKADALVFKLLPLLKHLLHVLHVLRGQLVQLFQRLLITFLSLRVGGAACRCRDRSALTTTL